MLPGSAIRRRTGVSVTEGMHRLTSVMNDSARRYKRLPLAGKVIFVLTSVLSIILYTVVFRSLVSHNVDDDKFLEIDSCPACFGSSGCGLVYYNQVKFTGWSNYRIIDRFNSRNVRFATLSDNQGVVLKKLGTDEDIKKLDNKVCKDANRPDGCDIGRVLFITNLAGSLRTNALEPKHLTQVAGMFTCASYRLMDRLWTYYKERRKQKQITMGDKLQLWYTANLNPEPLLLQTFPASERWPFPEYFGACGRHVIVEHVGRTLKEFYNEPFHKRAGLAYELIRIADHLTENQEDFALYITDPSWENFGVDASGKVRILDAENIIVVDKLAIEAKKRKGYDQFLQSDHLDCTDSTCLSMVPSKLCIHLHSDHNYYAICSSLLDPLINDGVMPGGLLHSMPEEAKDYWDLEHLLKECVRPSKHKGRIIAKTKLLIALTKLHQESTEHLEPHKGNDPRGIPLVKLKKELWEYDDYDDGDADHDGGDKGKARVKFDDAKDIDFDEGKGEERKGKDDGTINLDKVENSV